MDLSDIFKKPAPPVSLGKRKAAGVDDYIKRLREEEEESSVPAKSLETSTQEDNEYNVLLPEDANDIEGYMEAGDKLKVDSLDLTGLKKMVLKFEKALSKNRQLRIKFATEPTRFLDSETELHEQIRRLSQLATAPYLFPDLVALNVIPSILSLLSHDNSDISLDVIELLNELTDEEVAAEVDPDVVEVLYKALMEEQIFELLMQNIKRLNEDEPEEKQGVFNILSIFENFVSYNINTARTLVEKTEIMGWIIKRIKEKSFDSIKQYASEILAILLQNSTENRLQFGAMEGVDLLLVVIANYKKKDPKSSDECEFLENCFDALCSMLMEPSQKKFFIESEGIELMLIIIRENNMARLRAPKVLSFALSGAQAKETCSRFIQLMGLKSLFSMFMQKGHKKLKKLYPSFVAKEEEEQVLSILLSLFKHVDSPLEKLRLLNKFAENEFEKIDRLLEMLDHYHAKVESAKKLVEEDIRDIIEEVDEKEVQFEIYIRMLEEGLFTLQQVCYILAELYVTTDFEFKERIDFLLRRQGQTLKPVKQVLLEMERNMDDIGNEESQDSIQKDKEHLLAMCNLLFTEDSSSEIHPTIE